jgi:hypothetical protein
MTITGLTTFLWFDTEAEQAANLYVSTFPGSRITGISHYQLDAQKRAGEVLTVDFELFGQSFACINAGPDFPHSPAVSFQVFCDTQEEIDRLWDTLTADGGEPGRCGWCKDRFGVSWQVIPRNLSSLLGAGGEAGARAFGAMMGMGKLDIAGLQSAAAGG